MEFSGRLLLFLVLPLILRGMVDSALPAIAINTFPTYLQSNYQMQITCTYDSTVYRYDRWVHPTVGSIPTSYGRFTVIMNVNSPTVNLMYYRLQISSPQLSDVGTYYCIFSTIVGGVAFSSSATLVWKDPPQYQTPSRLVYRQFVQQSVLLECNVTNYIQFQWQFPLNYPVPLDSRVQLSGTSLYFSSLSLSNMGTYFCVTTNEITPAYTSFQAILVVYELPSVQVDNTSRVVNVSGHASFTCTARGSPQPSIVWTRENSNDNLVLSSSHVTVATNLNLGPYMVVSTIDFPSVTSNDTGVYRCTASNYNGSSYINVNLLLYGTPTAPTNVNVVTYNGSALNVSWQPPTSNGNLNILSYTVYWQAGPGHSVNSVTLSGFPPPTQYLIGGLEYLTNYSVSVVANNAKGKGYFSIPFIASTAATVPSLPANLTVKGLGSTSAVISWAVSDNGGSPVMGTSISHKSQGSRTTTVYIEGRLLEYELRDLPFNSSQTVLLSVLNSVGAGPAATLSFSTTDVPEAPLYVTTSTSWNAAVVCWPTPTLGQPYLLYRIGVQRVGPTLGSDVVQVDVKPYSATQSNGTTCVKVTLLQYDVCYNFTLRIQNAKGFSLPVYSTEQACTHREMSPQLPVLNSSQSKAQFITLASGAASGVIGFVLIVVVGIMVVIALATRTRVTKTEDHCLDSINSSTADTSKHSSSSLLAYKTEGHVPNSCTSLLQRETSLVYPVPSTLVLDYPQLTGVSSSSVGHFNQEVAAAMTQRQEEEEEEDGLTENPAFMQQNMEDRDSVREMWHTALPPFLGESCSQASPPPMFTVVDSGNCTAEDDTMFVENNAYETHEFQPPPEPEVIEPRFAIRSRERGAVREMVEINVGSK